MYADKCNFTNECALLILRSFYNATLLIHLIYNRCHGRLLRHDSMSLVIN